MLASQCFDEIEDPDSAANVVDLIPWKKNRNNSIKSKTLSKKVDSASAEVEEDEITDRKGGLDSIINENDCELEITLGENHNTQYPTPPICPAFSDAMCYTFRAQSVIVYGALWCKTM